MDHKPAVVKNFSRMKKVIPIRTVHKNYAVNKRKGNLEGMGYQCHKERLLLIYIRLFTHELLHIKATHPVICPCTRYLPKGPEIL